MRMPHFHAPPHSLCMYSPLCLLQAITFLEPLHGCAETDTPDVCRQLAECHLKNGAPAAAVTVYESIVDSESTGGTKVAVQRRTALLLPAIDGRPHCSAKGLSAASLQVTAGSQPSLLHGCHACGLHMHSQVVSGDMRAAKMVRLTLTAAPLQHHLPTRVSFCLCRGPHNATSGPMPFCGSSSLPWHRHWNCSLAVHHAALQDLDYLQKIVQTWFWPWWRP